MFYRILLILILPSLFVFAINEPKSTTSGNTQQNESNASDAYYLHQEITTTVFWIGEEASDANGHIANFASAWDVLWMQHYGGIDAPDRRNGYLPEGFVPHENPFYVALPYNDFDENGEKKKDIASYIPWASSEDENSSVSICKNRWVKIVKGNKTVYAQWEDVGPFEENDIDYVFGTSAPKNEINNNAGLDVSPAVRDYLGLGDIDTTSWQFVDERDVPDGPWKESVTTRNVDWVEWYRPGPSTTWQWQLQGELNRSYNVNLYDIDLFDTNVSTISALKRSGRRVICYFSAGSYEEWREDAGEFPESALGKALDDWPGERWLDIRDETVKRIMLARLDLAKTKGCDGVEPDNVDGYTNDTGFPLSAADQLAYNKFIATEARDRGLSVGLKNDLDQTDELQPFFDFALNEECHIYNECDRLKPFIEYGKPVFNAEYAKKYLDNTDGARDKLCRDSGALGLRTLILPTDLDDAFRYSCDGDRPAFSPGALYLLLLPGE